ncbi:MAG TPA: 3-methyl-2-oxobutanoate hydroxymethyltransferase [Actinomycetota bacterium]|nr:3-methyl-2-oxobutanoate hydroxymethyltransferase [Actinomycetota bacterium]
MPVTIHDLRAWKAAGERFVMLTAYDTPTARILDEAGVPVLLVGDSVGNNVLGYANTLPVTMEEMLHHTRAVARGVRNALVVGDMPFGSYQASVEEGIRNAVAFVKAGAGAVKVEGVQVELTHRLTDLGIPVMGHIGLTPQFVHAMGGYRVQGRTEEQALRLREQAEALEKAGVFSLVLEGVPSPVGRAITQAAGVPTIGIGAGPDCDAQVLVLHDLLGINERLPRFAKAYADLRTAIGEAARAFVRDVAAGAFPDARHSYE